MVYLYLLWLKHGSQNNTVRAYEQKYNIPKSVGFKLMKWGTRMMKGFHLHHLTPRTYEERKLIAQQRIYGMVYVYVY